jgi:hypothetical protein
MEIHHANIAILAPFWLRIAKFLPFLAATVLDWVWLFGKKNIERIKMECKNPIICPTISLPYPHVVVDAAID